MRLFGSLYERKAVDADALTWAQLLGETRGSKAGVAVNLDTAARVSTVFSCGRVLSEDIAQLPREVQLIDGRNRSAAVDHPVYKLLKHSPNEWMTGFEFFELMMWHAVLTFNAYAYIGWGGGVVQELIPIVDPVRVERLRDYSLLYHLSTGETLPQESVLHFRGPSWNGFVGLDALHLAREAVGLAIATEETHARLFANGAQTGGVLSVEGRLNQESRQRLEARAKEKLEGLRNAFSTLVLDQNAKWQSMASSGVDSQHLETRRFQVEEICRFMRVFPQMVMHEGKSPTFASAEQFFLAHVMYSILPWVRRWEEKLEHALLKNDPKYRVKLNVNALMRGDAAQRSTFYEKALGGARGETAFMTRNEVRELEDLNPIEGGDVLPTPLAPAVPGVPIGGPDKNPAPVATE